MFTFRKWKGQSVSPTVLGIMDITLLVYLALWYLGAHGATHPAPKSHPADVFCARA